MEKIVLLLSGGIDSSVLFGLLKMQNKEVLPLFIDYGQRNKSQELRSARYIANFFHCKLQVVQNSLEFASSLLIKGIKNTSPFLPHRNLFLIVIGAIYAYQNNCNAIAIGIHSGTDYFDSTKSFIEKASISLEEGIGEKIILFVPFVDIKKEDIILLASELEIPIKKTYSCYMGKSKHCKKCGACIQRFHVLNKFRRSHV